MRPACILADLRPHHSEDIMEVWHGRADPLYACGYHFTYFLDEVYAASRGQ